MYMAEQARQQTRNRVGKVSVYRTQTHTNTHRSRPSRPTLRPRNALYTPPIFQPNARPT